ncbi:hypothetical protein SPADD19_01231 [Streptococcus parasanguinis]|nr:hypothetical protein SPADD19_01231 [Streptococcus parasanguinis]
MCPGNHCIVAMFSIPFQFNLFYYTMFSEITVIKKNTKKEAT